MRYLWRLVPAILATTLGLALPAKAEMTFGELCQRIISSAPIPPQQSYVLLKQDQGRIPFEGNLTTCVIWQMAAFNLHQLNWDYAKEQVQGFNQQDQPLRNKVAIALQQGHRNFSELKALMDLKYVQLEYSQGTGYRATLGPGPVGPLKK